MRAGRPDSRLGANGPQAAILGQEHQLGAKRIGLKGVVHFQNLDKGIGSIRFFTVAAHPGGKG